MSRFVSYHVVAENQLKVKSLLFAASVHLVSMGISPHYTDSRLGVTCLSRSLCCLQAVTRFIIDDSAKINLKLYVDLSVNEVYSKVYKIFLFICAVDGLILLKHDTLERVGAVHNQSATYRSQTHSILETSMTTRAEKLPVINIVATEIEQFSKSQFLDL